MKAMRKQLNQTAMFPEPEAPSAATPNVGDTHWSWTGFEWIPCVVTELSSSGKSFKAWNKDIGYGTYMWKPVKEFVSTRDKRRIEDPDPRSYNDRLTAAGIETIRHADGTVFLRYQGKTIIRPHVNYVEIEVKKEFNIQI